MASALLRTQWSLNLLSGREQCLRLDSARIQCQFITSQPAPLKAGASALSRTQWSLNLLSGRGQCLRPDSARIQCQFRSSQPAPLKAGASALSRKPLSLNILPGREQALCRNSAARTIQRWSVEMTPGLWWNTGNTVGWSYQTPQNHGFSFDVQSGASQSKFTESNLSFLHCLYQESERWMRCHAVQDPAMNKKPDSKKPHSTRNSTVQQTTPKWNEVISSMEKQQQPSITDTSTTTLHSVPDSLWTVSIAETKS
jgi:hypothetical protein